MAKQIVILYSGGLDSFIMYRMAKIANPDANVTCLYFMHGADAEEAELERLPDYVTIRHIDWLDDKIRPKAKDSMPIVGAVYIPGRNLVFAVLAACIDLPDEIWLGAMADENNKHATDKNEYFREETSKLLSYVLEPFIPSGVKIVFPFVERNMNKFKSVEWALENGITKKELASTTSCWYNNEDGPCGECIQCLKRWLVFSFHNIPERYRVYPLNSKKQREIIARYLAIDVPDTEDDENIIYMIHKVIHPVAITAIKNEEFNNDKD